jgi:hypothetical protein
MEDGRRAGRIIGVLIILQMVGSGVVNGVLEAPLFGTQGFLVSGAPHAGQVALAALLGLVTEAMWVGIAITAFPILCRRAQGLALWFVALAGVILAAAVVESSTVMSMVSLSEAYTKASAVDRAQFESLQVVVASARDWTHYLARICDGAAMFLFYAAMYRFALIPRVLAGFGLLAVVSMLTSVARPLFGHDVVFPMLAPTGVSQLILAVWLITKGFRDQPGLGTEPSDS